MKDLQDLKDLTMHDAYSISDEYTTLRQQGSGMTAGYAAFDMERIICRLKRRTYGVRRRV